MTPQISGPNSHEFHDSSLIYSDVNEYREERGPKELERRD